MASAYQRHGCRPPPLSTAATIPSLCGMPRRDVRRLGPGARRGGYCFGLGQVGLLLEAVEAEQAVGGGSWLGGEGGRRQDVMVSSASSVALGTREGDRDPVMSRGRGSVSVLSVTSCWIVMATSVSAGHQPN